MPETLTVVGVICFIAMSISGLCYLAVTMWMFLEPILDAAGVPLLTTLNEIWWMFFVWFGSLSIVVLLSPLAVIVVTKNDSMSSVIDRILPFFPLLYMGGILFFSGMTAVYIIIIIVELSAPTPTKFKDFLGTYFMLATGLFGTSVFIGFFAAHIKRKIKKRMKARHAELYPARLKPSPLSPGELEERRMMKEDTTPELSPESADYAGMQVQPQSQEESHDVKLDETSHTNIETNPDNGNNTGDAYYSTEGTDAPQSTNTPYDPYVVQY